MILRILRHATWPALLAAGTTSACTSPPATADAFVASYIQPSFMMAAACPFGSRKEWVDVGSPTGTQPTTVSDGNSQSGGNVSVSCSVHPNGSSFDLNLNAGLTGSGSMTITSSPNAPVSYPAGGMHVTGTFLSGANGRYASDSCAISYMYNNGKVPNTQPIAGGRIWAHLSCVNAQRTDGAGMLLPDGGTTPDTCDTEADFIFENCSQ
jgi:hypothetical protein